jgi:hypothetical protein
MRGGHIAAVEILDVKSDEEAVGKCAAYSRNRNPNPRGLRFGTSRAKSPKLRLAKTTDMRTAWNSAA